MLEMLLMWMDDDKGWYKIHEYRNDESPGKEKGEL